MTYLIITGIAQGKLKFHFTNLDLHPFIQESLEGLRADIDKKEIQITLGLTTPEHHVRADPVRVRQIFGNLLVNAIKFTPSFGQITVRSFNVGGNLHIEIADTGLGITEGELPRIFGEFVPGDEATSAHFGGLSLGLFTAEFLVRGHGGRIWAESAGRDKGATFHVELPISATPAPKPRSYRANATPCRASRSACRRSPLNPQSARSTSDSTWLFRLRG
jgi:signal transduction histidine kinase